MATLVVVWAAVVAPISPARAGLSDDIRTAEAALHAWDIPGAAKAVERMKKRSGYATSGLAQLTTGRLLLMQSEYTRAAKVLEAAAALEMPADARMAVAHYGPLAASTAKAIEGYRMHRTSGGHFEIAYQPGIDEVLLPYADRMLEQAWTQLTALFGHTPPAPVRVEIYPHVEVLGQVSSLTVKEIKTSGTIALCKYNRLMIVSPRELVYGYSWLDTLSHEFIHLLVSQKSRNTVPIWLHEGLAKYYEVKWRGAETPSKLGRSSEDLLARALATDQLISFEAMSPSMAKLPSQEATATAFAEVHMVMEFLETRSGATVPAQLPHLMAKGMTDKQAVAALARMKWGKFEPAWKAYLKGKGLRAGKTKANNVKLLFKGDDTEKAELAELEQTKARNHTWLGDQLRLKGRFNAAAKQYRKAAKFAGPATAIIQAKLGHALLRLGQLDTALAELRRALAQTDNYVLLHLYAGEAYLRLGRLDKARHHLEAAIALNPFDPQVHGHLATVYTKLKLQARAAEERKLHKRLGVHMQ